MHSELLHRLRNDALSELLAHHRSGNLSAVVEEFISSGVRFVSTSSLLEERFTRAISELFDCMMLRDDDRYFLIEGGVYRGCWLESTGTINAEVLSRFIPSVAEHSFELFADGQRDDGLMPYKWEETGPAFRQIQMVTPLARSVWHHDQLHGNVQFLRKMYEAMAKFDAWLVQHRNTRGTGCVEAFCTFDTGHDLSSRFWHIPDTPHADDPAQYDPDSPILPLLAPDLTANVYAQRKYMSKIAAKLGDEAASERWLSLADESLRSLMTHCYDEADQFFYDVDRNERFIRIQSDVLSRVLACEVGDQTFFAQSLRKYLLNTRKFFAKYPFTSVAMDDPRFDPHTTYNSWAGTTNFLTLIRSPHAFEYHRHHVELTWVMQPIIAAAARMTEFSQTISPWTGEQGFTKVYSPSILCFLDFIERLCGIVPRPDGKLSFNCLTPYGMDHGRDIGMATAYSRTVDGQHFEMVNTPQESTVYRDGQLLYQAPRGIRIVTDREGELQSIIGMSARRVQGELHYGGHVLPFLINGNEHLVYIDGAFEVAHKGEIVFPSYE